ncbi:hypothetical protein [Streptomyces sp. NPDC090135]|uniref:hypothetical protein n=1 Tax=Streptomyces sp. NPDC090135 TaxID=3365957 RepID=UPI003810FED7
MAEDRNDGSDYDDCTAITWRSLFGAAEDHNDVYASHWIGEIEMAVALRGDRGSQHRDHQQWGREQCGWRSPVGVAEDRNSLVNKGQAGSGR